MADLPDSFDVTYASEIAKRVKFLEEEEDREIEDLIAARREAAKVENQQSQEDPAPQPETDTETEEDDTSFLGDLTSGILGGVRDGLVNIGQTALDFGGLVDSGIKLDELAPDVEDRDSGVHAFTRSTAQFLTGFIPVLGAMKWAGSISKVSSVLKATRASGLGSALTGGIAKATVAGAVADFSVFNPFEARFSDMIQDLGIDNPITNFLAVDEEDSALEGRLKNVVEGAGLGLAFDGLLRGLIKSKGLLKTYHQALDSDVAPDVAKAFHDVQQGVLFERQNLDEAKILLEEWDRVAAVQGDAGIVAARGADLNTDTIQTEIAQLDDFLSTREAAGDAADFADEIAQAESRRGDLGSALDHIEGAKQKNVTFDEHAAPFDEDARANSGIEQLRSQDPDLAVRIEDTGRVTREAMATHIDEVTTNLTEAETAFFNFPTTEAYHAPKTRSLKKEYGKQLDDFKTQRNEKEIAEAHAAAEKDAANHPGETRAEAMARFEKESAEVVAAADAELKAKGIHDVADDGTELINTNRLKAHITAKTAAGTYNIGKVVDVSDPVMLSAITKIFTKARGNIVDLDVKSLGQLIGANNFNTRRMVGDGGMKEMVDELHTFLTVQGGGRRGGTKATRRSLDETLERADKVSRLIANQLGDPQRSDAILNAYKTWFGESVSDLDVRITAIRSLEEATRSHASELVNKVIGGGISGAGRVTQSDLVFAYHNFVQFANIRDGVATELGRGLSSFRAIVGKVPILTDAQLAKSGGRNAKQFEKVLESIGGAQSVNEMAGIMKTVLDNPRGLDSVIRSLEGRNSTLMKLTQEFWLNAILSGPITQTVNVLSNTAVILWSPMEKVIEGAFRGDADMLRGAAAEYRGMVEGFRASFRIAEEARGDVFKALGEFVTQKPGAALRARVNLGLQGDNVGTVWRSLLGDEPVIIQNAKVFDVGDKAFTSAGIGRRAKNIAESRFKTDIGPLKEDSFGGRVVDSLGTVIRMPSRLLTTGDELAKTINYHMALNRLGFEDALSKNIAHGDLDKHIKQFVQDVPTHKTSVTLDLDTRTAYAEIDELAKDQARINTFTSELPDNSFGKAVQTFTSTIPAMRFLVPFVRTPTNLLKYSFERTPGAHLISRRYRDLAKAAKAPGATQRDIAAFSSAKARMLIGGGIYAGIGMATFNGVITGAGPSQPDERRALLATGWQPNSFRISQDDGSFTYISYNRSDPFGMMIGVVATLAEAVGQADIDEFGEAVTAAALGISETLQSKSYFTGITSIVAAVDRPDQRLERYLSQMSASFIPNILGSTNRTGVVAGFGPIGPSDPVMREVADWTDALLAKLPGYSATLPPRRNIFGEVISYAMGVGPDMVSPFQSRTSPNTLVNKEIQRLVQSHGFGLSMNGYRSIGNIELTPEQKDRYIVLTSGDPHRNGRDLRDDLETLFKSSKYKRADSGIDGKQDMIRKLYEKRRRRARKIVKRENKDLALAIRERRRLRKLAQREELEKQASNNSSGGVNSLIASLTTPPRNLS